MCGRYKLTVPFSEIVRLYGVTSVSNLQPHYNIAPTQDIAVVRRHEHSRQLAMLRWGLIPWWAKDAKLGLSTINAKAETVASKPAFRDAFKERRCLVIADGFYEWKKLDAKTKQPYLIQMRDHEPFAFAGLWDRWRDRAKDVVLETATIITTEPNELCAPIHNRMPAILARDDYAAWLGEKPAEPAELLTMLKPYPAAEMEAIPIGRRIGNVKFDDPALIEPVGDAERRAV